MKILIPQEIKMKKLSKKEQDDLKEFYLKEMKLHPNPFSCFKNLDPYARTRNWLLLIGIILSFFIF